MQEFTDKTFDKKQSKYRISKKDYDDNLNYDLDKVSKEVLEGYIEVGKFYTSKYIDKLSTQFPSIINNKKIQKILIAKINKFINPSQVRDKIKSSRIKVDIVTGYTKVPIDPNTYCQSRGLRFDVVLYTCVNWSYGGAPSSSGGIPTGTGRDGGSGPSPPSLWSDGLYGKDGYTIIKPSTYLIETLSITDPSLITYLNGNQTNADALVAYLDLNGYTQENMDFTRWAVGYLYGNVDVSVNDLLFNRTDYDNFSGDLDNNISGGYDLNQYSSFDSYQSLQEVGPIISKDNFIGWGYPGIKRNCMDYAKAQISKNGYQISNYFDSGQTFLVYSEQSGVNQTQ